MSISNANKESLNKMNQRAQNAQLGTVIQDLQNASPEPADGSITLAKLSSEAKLQSAVVHYPAGFFLLNPSGTSFSELSPGLGFVAPADITVISMGLVLDAAIAAGDATNHWEVNIQGGDPNGSPLNMLAANESLVAGLQDFSSKIIVADQNQNLAAGDQVYPIFALEDEAGGIDPSDLSNAYLWVTINYILR